MRRILVAVALYSFLAAGVIRTLQPATLEEVVIGLAGSGFAAFLLAWLAHGLKGRQND